MLRRRFKNGMYGIDASGVQAISPSDDCPAVIGLIEVATETNAKTTGDDVYEDVVTIMITKDANEADVNAAYGWLSDRLEEAATKRPYADADWRATNGVDGSLVRRIILFSEGASDRMEKSVYDEVSGKMKLQHAADRKAAAAKSTAPAPAPKPAPAPAPAPKPAPAPAPKPAPAPAPKPAPAPAPAPAPKPAPAPAPAPKPAPAPAPKPAPAPAPAPAPKRFIDDDDQINALFDKVYEEQYKRLSSK